jgi:hypothetical protein
MPPSWHAPCRAPFAGPGPGHPASGHPLFIPNAPRLLPARWRASPRQRLGTGSPLGTGFWPAITHSALPRGQVSRGNAACYREWAVSCPCLWRR